MTNSSFDMIPARSVKPTTPGSRYLALQSNILFALGEAFGKSSLRKLPL
ncbi:hypothetical protein KAU37_10580 [Candidatus Bipolaricaulota bacterium]|nr:hypothetical protein [Candidatus Bipolaricaulota bacterium]